MTSLAAGALVGRLRGGNFVAAVADVNMGLDPDPYPLLASAQVQSGGSNVSGFQDPTLDAALVAARGPGTDAARGAAYARLQTLLGTLEPVLVQARDVGAAIVDEAVERGADLLIVGLPYRKRFGGDFAIGRTVPYVLKNAPCAVWVVREPMPGEIHA